MLQTLCAFLLQLLASALVTALAAPVVNFIFRGLPPSRRFPDPARKLTLKAATAATKAGAIQQQQQPSTTTATLLRSRAIPRANPHTTANGPFLLNFPVELIESIVHYLQPNHPGAILNFALTCTSALPISLPILYSSIRVSNLSLLAPLSYFLAATPTLALRVQSITASPTCIHGFGYIKHAIDRYSPHAELGLRRHSLPTDTELDAYLRALTDLTMLTNKLESQCSAHDLQSLPLPLLTHVARTCPNLTSIDLSAMSVHAAPHFITYGVRDLVPILRLRRGKLHCPWFPFSSISLARSAAAVAGQPPLPEVHGIVGVDWGRDRRLSVVCIKSAPWLKRLRYPVDYCLMPVQELVAEDEMQRGEWMVLELPTDGELNVEVEVGG